MTDMPDTRTAAEPHDPGYPYGQFDARKWAAEFERIFADQRPDEDTMLGWFANAIMTGYDKATNDATPATGPERLNLERLTNALWGMDFRDPEARRLAEHIAERYAALGTPR